MKKTLLLCLLFSAAALGCGGQRCQRFQIVSAGEDKAFRLDTETGEVVYIVSSHGVPVDLPAKDKK